MWLRPDDHVLGCPQWLHMVVVHLLIQFVEFTIQRHGPSSKVAYRHYAAERPARILQYYSAILDAQELCYCATFVSHVSKARRDNGATQINRAGCQLQRFIAARRYRRSI